MRKKFIVKNHRKKKIIFSIIFILLFSIGIGYSVISTNLSINGTIDISKYNDNTLYGVLRLEALNNGLAREYTGIHHDSFTEEPSKKIYHWYAENDSEGIQILDKNNVIFANHCWQMIRTTDTGGVKMIYNGEAVDNQCLSTRGTHVGYGSRTSQNLASNYWYGTDYTYDSTAKTFKVSGTTEQTMWNESNGPGLVGKYTCKLTSEDGTCATLYLVESYYNTTSAYVIPLNSNSNYSQFGTLEFNASYNSPTYVGYMYGDVYAYSSTNGTTSQSFTTTQTMLQSTSLGTSYWYADSIDYGTLTVISSIFENNTCFKTWYRGTHIGTAGIYNRGTLDVSYSAFINNTKIKNIGRIENLNMNEDVYTESSNVKSLDLNWWGSDDNPTDLGLSNYEKINNWFYLDIAPEYLALNINETADVTANFKLSNPNIAFDSGKIPKFNITFSSIVNDKFLYESKNLINNSASVVFDLTQTKGQYVLLTSIGVYSKPTIIDVGKNVSLMNVSVSDIIYGNDLKVNVSVMNNQSQSLKGNVTFKINKKTYNVKLNDGSCTASISGLDPGNYVLKVIYEGNEDYFKSIQYFNVTVNKIPTNLSIVMPEVVYIGNKAIFNTTLMPENFKIKANLYLNGVKDNILYIYGGNTTISLGVRPIGEYNLTVELWNNTYYESSTATATFRVEKYDVNIDKHQVHHP